MSKNRKPHTGKAMWGTSLIEMVANVSNQTRRRPAILLLVRLKGLEPSRLESLDPKSSASTNSATGAAVCHLTGAKIQFSKHIGKF